MSRTCPSGYTFFNDKAGNSLCCKGKYIANGRTCSGKNKDDVCAFIRDVRDPRTPGRTLRTCDEIADDLANSGAGKYCTSNMPNYIAPGNSPNSTKNGGCSISPAEGDGSVFPRQPGSNQPTTPYCFISGASAIMDRMRHDNEFKNPSCETVKLQETVKCPANMSVKYDKQMYVHCMLNNYKYDPKNNVPPFCHPDEVVALLPIKTTGKMMGLEKAKTSCMSCSYYKKRFLDKDTTATCEEYRG